MKNCLCLLLAVLFMVCLRLSPAGAAPDFEATRLNAVAANPPGVSLTLSLPPGRTQFHQGEVIPLTVTFSSRLPKAYRLNAGPGISGSGDRELPWNSDTFQVDDTGGAVDPLPTYYAHEFATFGSGGGPQFQDLTAQAVSIPYTLNEWLRFDAPGRYRVYLTSGRVVDVGRNRPGIFPFQGRTTTSNAVELEILPDDPALDAQTLQQALPLFNEEGFHSSTQIARQAAVRAIRFLGTPDAVRAMVARYGQFTDYEQWNYFSYRQTRLGLYGYPQPSVVIQEMQSRLADPDFPIFSIFLEDMAQTQFFAAYPQPLPPLPTTDPKIHQWHAARFHFAQVLMALAEQNRQSLALAVDAKQGKARAISLYTLLHADYMHTDPAEYEAVARALVPVFDDLTPEEQNNLLDSDLWCKINKPVLLPILRRVYARPQPNADKEAAKAYEAVKLTSLTLRRLTELSPAEGRALLLAEIKSLHPRVDLPTLCSLPDRTLPALDDTLAANLENCLQGRGSSWQIEPRLVQRYGTRAILTRVKADYSSNGGEWGGDIQTCLLAYFLRMDPTYGLEQMRKALAWRKDNGWYRYALSGVAALAPGTDMERLAVTYLHDPDPEVVVDAVKTLGDYGSSTAEAPLWARMREWHRQELGTSEEGTPTSGELEYVFTSALATAPGWLADRAKLRALADLCVTPNGRTNVAALLPAVAGAGHDHLHARSGSVGSGPVPSASSRLPPWKTSWPNSRAGRSSDLPTGASPSRVEQAQAFGQLKPFLEARGMRLEEEPFPVR